MKDSSQFYEIFQKTGCCLFEVRQKGKALFLCNYINVVVTSTCEELKLKCPTTYLDDWTVCNSYGLWMQAVC